MAQKTIFLLVDRGIPRCVYLYCIHTSSIRNIPCAVRRGYVIGFSIGVHIYHILYI